MVTFARIPPPTLSCCGCVQSNKAEQLRAEAAAWSEQHKQRSADALRALAVHRQATAGAVAAAEAITA